MTDCCLFVCMRPRTYQRLINDIYHQHRNNRYDDAISPSESKIRRLIDYVSTYPNKLRLVTTKLDRLFLKFLANGSIGFTLLTVEIYRVMLHQFYHLQLTYLLEPHVNFILLQCIQSRRVVYLRAAAVLMKDCVKYSAFSTNLSFFASVLELCDAMHEDHGESQENRTYSFIGFTMLISLLKVLHHFPAWMETFFDHICGTIYRGLVACGATRFRGGGGEHSQRNRDNSVAALLHGRSLYAYIMKTLPRTLEDLCWKALQRLCATHSLSTVHAVVNYMCLALETSQITVSSKLSIQTLTIITLAYEDFSGMEYLLENALLDYVVYRLNDGKGSRQSMATTAPDQHQRSATTGGGGSAPFSTTDYHFLHVGSKQRIQQAGERLSLLQDVVNVLQIWRDNHKVLTAKSKRSSATRQMISLESFVYLVRSLLHVQAYLLSQYPCLLSMDLFAPVEQASTDVLAGLAVSVRALPTKLRPPPIPPNDTTDPPTDDAAVMAARNSDEATVCALLQTMYRLTQALAMTCAPLGTNVSLLWDQLLATMQRIEDERFVGVYHNNKTIAMFRVHGLFLCQLLAQAVPLSVPSIQLSTLMTTHGGGPTTATGQTLVSDYAWDLLHRWLVDARHWEELRHVLLTMLKLVGVAAPAIRQLLHAHVNTTLSASTAGTWNIPVFQTVMATDGATATAIATAAAASSRTPPFTFFPFSLKQMHFLHSVLFDHLEVMGAGLSALRVVVWSRWLQTMLSLYGEYEVLLSLPVVLTLLQEAEHVWDVDPATTAATVPPPVSPSMAAEPAGQAPTATTNEAPTDGAVPAEADTAAVQEDAAAPVDASQPPSDAAAAATAAVTAAAAATAASQAARLQAQRETHRRYLRAFAVHYFSLLAHGFQIPALTTLLQQWQQQHGDTAAAVFPAPIVVNIDDGRLTIDEEVLRHEYAQQSTATGPGSPLAPAQLPPVRPLNTAEIMRKLLAHPRFQPLALHVTRAFEQSFVPFSDEYVSDLVDTSSVFGGRAASRSRAASFASQHPDGGGGDGDVGAGRSRATSRASSTASHRTPGKILTQNASFASTAHGGSHAAMLPDGVPRMPGTRSVASAHTAMTHATHATHTTHATTHVPVRTTIHQLAFATGPAAAAASASHEGLAVVETFLSDQHAYPAMSFPYKTRVWKDAFLGGVADMERLRGVEDVVRYLDDLVDDDTSLDDPGPMILADQLMLTADDEAARWAASPSPDEAPASPSFMSWLPTFLEQSFSS